MNHLCWIETYKYFFKYSTVNYSKYKKKIVSNVVEHFELLAYYKI
jgi:hypothetical protein